MPMSLERQLRYACACLPAQDWAAGRTPADAWRNCPRPAWMIWWIARTCRTVADRRKLARLILRLTPSAYRPRRDQLLQQTLQLLRKAGGRGRTRGWSALIRAWHDRVNAAGPHRRLSLLMLYAVDMLDAASARDCALLSVRFAYLVTSRPQAERRTARQIRRLYQTMPQLR